MEKFKLIQMHKLLCINLGRLNDQNEKTKDPLLEKEIIKIKGKIELLENLILLP